MQLASTKLGEEGNVQGSRQGLKLERRLCVTPHEAPLMTKSCTLGFLRSHQRGRAAEPAVPAVPWRMVYM